MKSVSIMETDEIYVKIMPLGPTAPRRCGVCDELLVIPPIYSCNSVAFICGPCFEGYRYYLDDDELRAADKPVRQILYENFASKFLFHCSYYPHCTGTMAFHHEAKLHYREYCIAKFFYLYKCPITRANRWFLRPNQHYCDWRFTRNSLMDNEVDKLVKHIRLLHSEYILERPHILNLKDLLTHHQPRQLFLLSLEENGIIAVLMTEITKTEIIFRCRVSDPDLLSKSDDPYECCISLIPPHERFRSIIDMKFECVRLDSNEIECPWHSLRYPIRHMIAETAFQINVFPRSVMLHAIPYLHTYRQMCKNVEDDSKCSSEKTISNPASVRAESERLSIPSSNSSDQTIELTTANPELWEHEEVEIEITVPRKVKEGEASNDNNPFHDDISQCQLNEDEVCCKPITKRATASVLRDRPRNDDDQEIKKKVRKKSSTSRNLFGEIDKDEPKNNSTEDNISNSPFIPKVPDFSLVATSNSENLPQNLQEFVQVVNDVFDKTNSDLGKISDPSTCYDFIISTTAANDSDCFSTSSSSSDDPPMHFRIPSAEKSDGGDVGEQLPRECDCAHIIRDDAFRESDECKKTDIVHYMALENLGIEDYVFMPLSPPNSDEEHEITSRHQNVDESIDGMTEHILDDIVEEFIEVTTEVIDDTDEELQGIRLPTPVGEDLAPIEITATENLRSDRSIVRRSLETLLNESSLDIKLWNKTSGHQLKPSSSEGNLLFNLACEDFDLSNSSSNSYGTISSDECSSEQDYTSVIKIPPYRNGNKENVQTINDDVYGDNQNNYLQTVVPTRNQKDYVASGTTKLNENFDQVVPTDDILERSLVNSTSIRNTEINKESMNELNVENQYEKREELSITSIVEQEHNYVKKTRPCINNQNIIANSDVAD